MPLNQTTIISLDNNIDAEQQYIKLANSNKIIMVVLGDTDAIQQGVILADKLARQITTNEELWVLWIGNHSVLKNKFEVILKSAGIIQNKTPYEEIKAFCLSKNPRKAASRIHKNGTMSPFRLTLLFREAIAS